MICFLFWVLGAPRIFLPGGLCVEVLEIFPPQLLAISQFQVMLFLIRGLRHSKIAGRNKLKDVSLAKQTTLGPMNLCATSPEIIWKGSLT